MRLVKHLGGSACCTSQAAQTLNPKPCCVSQGAKKFPGQGMNMTTNIYIYIYIYIYYIHTYIYPPTHDNIKTYMYILPHTRTEATGSAGSSQADKPEEKRLTLNLVLYLNHET
jgi:hypothetical protein